jgi:hypothetical protein
MFRTRDFRITKQGNLHITVLVEPHIQEDTAVVAPVSYLCNSGVICIRRQNDVGREVGDAEEHFATRMRWLRQEDHREVSRCL